MLKLVQTDARVFDEKENIGRLLNILTPNPPHTLYNFVLVLCVDAMLKHPSGHLMSDLHRTCIKIIYN
jgi:hypothetical protein